MNKIAKNIIITAIGAITLGQTHAAISISNTGSLNEQIGTGGVVLDNFTISSNANTAIFVLFSIDATPKESIGFSPSAVPFLAQQRYSQLEA